MNYGCKFFLYFARSMRNKSVTRYCITFFLLLIFFQQMGAGLFIHNLFHDTKQTTRVPFEQNESKANVNFTCNCVDDFLMPFVEADVALVLQKPFRYTNPPTIYDDRICFTDLIFFSLRGPPSLIG